MSNTRYPKSMELELTTDGHQIAHLKKMILGQLRYTKAQRSELGQYLAVDCEMVGLGPGGKKDSLARVSIVNYYGAIVLDTFVRQATPVTDYRTRYSGVRPEDVEGPNAQDFSHVKKTVKTLIKGRTLIGHTLHKDLQVLHLSHPPSLKNDVRENPDWKWKFPEIKTPGLKMLVQNELGVRIQDGEHDSVTDARAALALFCLHEGGSRLDLAVTEPQSCGSLQNWPPHKMAEPPYRREPRNRPRRRGRHVPPQAVGGPIALPDLNLGIFTSEFDCLAYDDDVDTLATCTFGYEDML
ncbi:3'-5' exonuclease [Tulasnella sp. JGI-2019a]|nr:3'-5' exonuclease [Tulasnella sp. JGI-2019a]